MTTVSLFQSVSLSQLNHCDWERVLISRRIDLDQGPVSVSYLSKKC